MTIRKAQSHHRPTHKRHARLHLPHMNADEALLVVAVLERAVQAIWRTHGDDMADQLAAAADLEVLSSQDTCCNGTQANEDCGF